MAKRKVVRKRKLSWAEKLMPDACPEGMQFAKRFNGLQQAWRACENPSWMLWYIDGFHWKGSPKGAVDLWYGADRICRHICVKLGIKREAFDNYGSLSREARVEMCSAIRRFLPKAPTTHVRIK